MVMATDVLSDSSAQGFEEVHVTVNNLEGLLDEDATFIDFFNAFLALPTFPVRLHYNGDSGRFEEFKYKLADGALDNNVKQATSLKRCSFFKSTIDEKALKIGYYVKFLERDEGITWIKENRLPLFQRSEMYAEFKLARLLSIAQTEYLVNILRDSIYIRKAAFDNRTSPAYRVRRNHGQYPGLAEFQKQFQSDGNGDVTVAVSQDTCGYDSDVSDLEFSKIHSGTPTSLEGICDKISEIETTLVSSSLRGTSVMESKSEENDKQRSSSGQSVHSNWNLQKEDGCLQMENSADVSLVAGGKDEAAYGQINLLSMLGSLSNSYSSVAGPPRLAFATNSMQTDIELDKSCSERLDQNDDFTKVNNSTPINVASQLKFEENLETWQDEKLSSMNMRSNGDANALKPLSVKRYSLPVSQISISGNAESHVNDRLQDSRRQSLPFASLFSLLQVESSHPIAANGSKIEQFNKLFAKDSFDLLDRCTQDALRSFYIESDSDDDDGGGPMASSPRKPIDLATKLGMDAFKLFLINTPGEKFYLLWIEIEKLKSCCDEVEQLSLLQEIRQRFFKSGSPYEISSATLCSWDISRISEIDISTLVSIQSRVLMPLKSYWCARFTLHQKHKQLLHGADYVTDDHNCMKAKCTTHNKELTEVPQRPNTCFPNMRTRKLKALETVGKDFETGQTGSYRERTRSKSAYPRLIVTPNTKNVNLSERQLKMVTTMDESCGFRNSPYSTFKNDASSASDKAYIRLYIQPMPPANCPATTVVRSCKRLQNEGGNGNLLKDSLVDCLLHERYSGSYFFRQMQNQNDENALNCYSFWKDIQDYNEHFFSDSFSAILIRQKAGSIFNTYIINGSERNIRCGAEIQKVVHNKLDPPYEDSFDEAEEFALEVLAHAYKSIFSRESREYEEIKKIEKLKHLDIRSKLKRPKHKPDEKVKSKEADEDSVEKISVSEVNAPLPIPLDGITFESFVRNRNDLESFKEFLEHVNSKGLKDLLAWLEMENFRRSSGRSSQRDNYARSVNSRWLTGEYFFGANSPATKEGQQEVRKLAGGTDIPPRPPSPVILEAQKYVKARLERRWFVLFKESSNFKDKHKENNITEMVEDLIMKRRMQRSEAAWKILNSRWISGSRDVIALRQLLMDPAKCQQFRQFLSLKGDLMEHNVYFWLEVQKYKELCHRHVEEGIIRSKVQAINDVFIKSAVPPELQIDVPIEIAERLHEKTTARSQQYGPYLFREAQTTVFRIMFNHWKEYVSFRASVEDGGFPQHLEELVKKRRAELRAKKMNSERRRLARVAYEKKRREREDSERFKDRDKSKADISSFQGYEKALSLISEDEEAIMQVRFTYSRFTAQEQLSDYEQRMREEGCTLEDIEADVSHNHLNSDKKLQRRASALASDEGASVSGLSGRGGRKKSSGVFRANARDSLVKETIYESCDDSLKQKKYLDVSKRKFSDVSVKSFSNSKGAKNSPSLGVKTREQKGANGRRTSSGSKFKQPKQLVTCEDVSVSLEVGKTHYDRNLMPGPRRTGASLTTKCLREFDRTSEGRALNAGLPLINISGIEKEAKGRASGPTIRELRRPPSHAGRPDSKRSARVSGSSKSKKEAAANGPAAKIIVT